MSEKEKIIEKIYHALHHVGDDSLKLYIGSNLIDDLGIEIALKVADSISKTVKEWK